MHLRFLGNSDKLSPSRQEVQIKAIFLLATGYAILESCGILSMTTRLAIGSVAACLVGTLLGGDGEMDPEQQPRYR